MTEELQRTREAAERKQLFQQVLQSLRPMRRLPIWGRYAIATVVIVAFFALRLVLGDTMAQYPFLLFFPPIIAVSFALDRGSGYYSTLLAAALSTQLINGSGQLGWSEIIAVTVFVAVGLFCAAVIEALRLTVEELSESEERFRATFELAGVGVALVGLDGRWLQVNKRLGELLGYTDEEMRSRTFQDITYPADLEADLDLLRRLVAGEIPSYNMEKRYIRGDGSLLWSLLSVAVVRDARGVARYFISVVQDIRDRKAAEEVLDRDRSQLARLVEERTALLMRASEEQRRAEEALRQGEKLQAVGQLTGGIAHDFNNLLQVVSAGAQLLKSPRLNEERRVKVIDGLIQAASNAKDLTGRLLAFARRQPLNPEMFDLNDRLRAMEQPLRQTLGPRIELVLNLADELWPVRVDPSQLEVAVLNVAVNARDAMPQGGQLIVTTRNTMLGAALDGATADEYVDLKIRDTGSGMPPAVLSRAFEPFFTTKEPGRGTGLGLSQVHGFAKQSGGDIAIESGLGQGTSIILHLPRATSHGETLNPPRATDDMGQLMQHAAGRSVLVVDDNEEVAKFAGAMLEELGYEIRRAASGAQALSMLAATDQRFDAVFSDIVMPGMSGLELAAAVRSCHPDVAVLLASGYSDALAAWEGERPAPVLAKPYQLLELADALDKCIAEVKRSRAAGAYDA